MGEAIFPDDENPRAPKVELNGKVYDRVPFKPEDPGWLCIDCEAAEGQIHEHCRVIRPGGDGQRNPTREARVDLEDLGRTVDHPTLDVHRAGKPEHFRARQRQGDERRILDRPAAVDDPGADDHPLARPVSPRSNRFMPSQKAQRQARGLSPAFRYA